MKATLSSMMWAPSALSPLRRVWPKSLPTVLGWEDDDSDASGPTVFASLPWPQRAVAGPRRVCNVHACRHQKLLEVCLSCVQHRHRHHHPARTKRGDGCLLLWQAGCLSMPQRKCLTWRTTEFALTPWQDGDSQSEAGGQVPRPCCGVEGVRVWRLGERRLGVSLESNLDVCPEDAGGRRSRIPIQPCWWGESSCTAASQGHRHWCLARLQFIVRDNSGYSDGNCHRGWCITNAADFQKVDLRGSQILYLCLKVSNLRGKFGHGEAYSNQRGERGRQQ